MHSALSIFLQLERDFLWALCYLGDTERDFLMKLRTASPIMFCSGMSPASARAGNLTCSVLMSFVGALASDKSIIHPATAPLEFQRLQVRVLARSKLS
jgi:hypothetical protein